MGVENPLAPMKHGGQYRSGSCFGGAGPGMRAQTSARRSDPHRQATGSGRRGTSLWEPFGSACSPAVGGRQDRLRGDVRAGLLGELRASGDQRPPARRRPPGPSLPGPTPFSSDRVPHQRHKRLLVNSNRRPFGRNLGGWSAPVGRIRGARRTGPNSPTVVYAALRHLHFP
jgi:hypothetical protein